MLANMRLLGLKSMALGEDWRTQVREIDELIVHEGLDLAEESIFLTYSHPPGRVMAQEGSCFIGRSVIGPRKEFPAPFQILDWKAGPVYLYPLQGEEWEEIWAECLLHWEELQRENRSMAPNFTLKLMRRLEPDLTLSMAVIFHE